MFGCTSHNSSIVHQLKPVKDFVALSKAQRKVIELNKQISSEEATSDARKPKPITIKLVTVCVFNAMSWVPMSCLALYCVDGTIDLVAPVVVIVSWHSAAVFVGFSDPNL